jgi:hypothetical protein
MVGASRSRTKNRTLREADVQRKPLQAYQSSAQSGKPYTKRDRHPWAMLTMALFLLLLASCVPESESPGRAQNTTPKTAIASISTGELEERYGARVSLIAVTAVGGLLDFRMKILDAGKARELFLGQAPCLMLDNRVILPPPEDSLSQIKQLQDGGMVVILYPNTNNAIKPGDKVTVLFDKLRLQPITVQ